MLLISQAEVTKTAPMGGQTFGTEPQNCGNRTVVFFEKVYSLQSSVEKWGKMCSCNEEVHSLQSSVQKWGKISACSEKVHS